MIQDTLKITKFNKDLKNNQLVAISGGQDSVFLLKLIENFYNKPKLYKSNQHKISYIYIDHQWRKDSYQQVMHIINYIKLTKRKIYIYQLPTHILSEKLCRIYRYHIIIKHAIKYENKIIITGHNKTDKIETFLNNFFRGSGLQGTTSLILQSKVGSEIYLLRPLLNLKRDRIYWTCKKFYLPIWSDNTNYRYNFDRNRIRNELIPYLKKYFHRNIEKSINSLLKNCYRDNEYIKQSTIKLYITSKHPLYIAINHCKLRKQNFTLQFKTLQLFCLCNLNLNIRQNEILDIIMNINISYKYFPIKIQDLNININEKWIYITL
uniref:tRNA(Ile)-lysidine synthase, chloroplastic n=1 Tax=Laurenciella marilzae TaxID=1413812 RepID=A0A1Z1M1T5_9FLOR|nr:tRNA Ile-lysidine synthetase [Laurenciella marilzae]ARW59733.1 tRNA Ile-lysidine synthetase [Laurenciella marilzae]